MQVIIDRFEGEYAVVETEGKQLLNLPRALVPADAKEGDTLEIRLLQTDRRQKIESLMDSLFEN